MSLVRSRRAAAENLCAASLPDGILGARKVMMISPLVLLLMPMSIARNFVFRLGAKRNILSWPPVDGRALPRTQLPVCIDEEALEGA
jgi:hypothetical protein